MTFRFVVDVEVTRSQGKFASREEIAALIQEALEQADPGQYSGDNGGEYETDTWSVSEEDLKPVKAPRRKATPETPAQPT